jgi:HEAT repeat protein
MEPLIFVLLAVFFIVAIGLIVAAYAFRFYHTFKLSEHVQFRNKMLPLIYEFMDEGTNYVRFKRMLTTPSELQNFATVLYELIEEFEGEERERLQKLLHLPALYTQKLQKLNSGNPESQIRACYYFGRLIYLRESVSDRIEWLLDSRDEYVSFAAASAMMASEDVGLRAKALIHHCITPGISRLSIIELMYQFHKQELEQGEQESEVILNLIQNDDTTDTAKLVLIRGTADIGYHQLIDFLYSYLMDRFKGDDTGLISVALIEALGRFEYGPLMSFLTRFGVTSPRGAVRFAAVRVLSQVDAQAHVELFVKMLDDKSSRVRVASAYALAQCGREGLMTLMNRQGTSMLSEAVIRRIVSETEATQYVD